MSTIADDPGTAHGSRTSADRLRPKKLPRIMRVVITTAMVSMALMIAIAAFRHYEYSPWTRDGRIGAYVVDSAPEISALVVDVPVRDNQFVHKGDLLYKLDPRDYDAALKHAQATLDAARARLALQEENLLRRQKLREGDVSAEEKQLYASSVRANQADVAALEASLYKARLDLERCAVRSTVNGYVTNLMVRVGNFATTGQRQMSIIDADSYWISGYFEETRLAHVRVGAPARAVLMGYPDSVITGRVESLNRGIADLNTAPNPQGLPEVNPVFTWVRLAQRIPVRIHIDQVPEGVHLAIGETCTVQVEQRK